MEYFEDVNHLDELDEYLQDCTFCPCCGMYLSDNPKGTVKEKIRTEEKEDGSESISYSGNYSSSQKVIELHQTCPRCQSELRIVYQLEEIGYRTHSRKRRDELIDSTYYPEIDDYIDTYSHKIITKEKTTYQYILQYGTIVCLKNGQRIYCLYDLDEHRWLTSQEAQNKKEREKAAQDIDLVKKVDKMLKKNPTVKDFDELEEMYRELKKIPTTLHPYVEAIQKQCEETLEKLLPEFKEKRKKDKQMRETLRKIFKATKILFIIAVIVCLGVRIKLNFVRSSYIQQASVNTEYTGHNKGGSCEHKYEFTLDESGILKPKDDILGGIASRDNVYIFKSGDEKNAIYDWTGPDSVYLEKGKYVALITPGDAIDYSRIAKYSLNLNFEAKKTHAPNSNIQIGQVYKDKLSSKDDVNTYQIKSSPNTKLIFQTNKPTGEYTGKISLFNNHSKSTLNEKKLFNVVVENGNGEVISSIDVSSISEINISSDKTEYYKIKVSAVDYCSDQYTFYTTTN